MSALASMDEGKRAALVSEAVAEAHKVDFVAIRDLVRYQVDKAFDAANPAEFKAEMGKLMKMVENLGTVKSVCLVISRLEGQG